jgi:hypothetical protein
MAKSYRVRWAYHDVPASVAPGANFTAHVHAQNLCDWTWPDPKTANPPRPEGGLAVRLAYTWTTADGKALLESSARGDIARPVSPDALGEFSIAISSPRELGSYQIHFDLVEELVTFFSKNGTEKLVVPVVVG